MDTKDKLKELQNGVVSGDVLAINLKDFPEDKFFLELVPSTRVMSMVLTVGSMLLPVITAYFEENNGYNDKVQDYNRMLTDEEAPIVDKPSMSLIGVATILSNELINPEFAFIRSELLDGLYHYDGTKVDLEKGFRGKRAVIIMMITELAIKENILIPLVHWLEKKGLIGIDTFLQQLTSKVKDSMQNLS